MSNEPSRTLILNRIRDALGAQPGPVRAEQCTSEWSDIPRQYRRAGTLTHEEILKLFDERIRHYNGTPFYSSGDVRSDIARILSDRDKHVLIIPPEFPSEWLPDGFLFVSDDQLSKGQLASNDGVVTTCTLAIALTGTVVLQSSPQQGRRAATLVPDYHLCVLRHENIVELVPEAIEKLRGVRDRPITFFSGPSATVDIEMTRVRGVHGPRTLDVLIV
jgi:L-lactate dehydrogenase complex protein LldG